MEVPISVRHEANGLKLSIHVGDRVTRTVRVEAVRGNMFRSLCVARISRAVILQVRGALVVVLAEDVRNNAEVAKMIAQREVSRILGSDG